MEMPRTLQVRGKVRGRMIELSEDPGLADGQPVEVQLKILSETGRWGEGLKRCAGALADDPEWDAIMEQIHQGRKQERRPPPEDE